MKTEKLKRIIFVALFSLVVFSTTGCKNSGTDENLSGQTTDLQQTSLYASVSILDSEQADVHLDLKYPSDALEGIASVTNIVAIGSFHQGESMVADGFIETHRPFEIKQLLRGEAADQVEVVHLGGTVPYDQVSKIYTPEELEKYHIDPENPNHTDISQTIEGMPEIKTGALYLVALEHQQDGRYILHPGAFSVCLLEKEDSSGSAMSVEALGRPLSETTGAEKQIFSVDDYLTVYDKTPKLDP